MPLRKNKIPEKNLVRQRTVLQYGNNPFRTVTNGIFLKYGIPVKYFWKYVVRKTMSYNSVGLPNPLVRTHSLKVLTVKSKNIEVKKFFKPPHNCLNSKFSLTLSSLQKVGPLHALL